MPQNFVQRLGGIKLDVIGDAEAASHRAAEQADAGGRADQRESRQGHRDRPGVHAGIERDVHLEILHGGIEIFLDYGR